MSIFCFLFRVKEEGKCALCYGLQGQLHLFSGDPMSPVLTKRTQKRKCHEVSYQPTSLEHLGGLRIEGPFFWWALILATRSSPIWLLQSQSGVASSHGRIFFPKVYFLHKHNCKMKAKCQEWPVAPSPAQGSMWNRRGPVSHHVVRIHRPSFPHIHLAGAI